jgi:gluconolactonase
MKTNPLLCSILWALAATAAQSADSVLEPIEGVVAANSKLEFIRDGFDGTEGPISLKDGSVIFTETKANRITRILADNRVSTYLENTNGANGLAFSPDGELIAVQTGQPKVGVLAPASKAKVLAEKFEGQGFQRPNDLVRAQNGAIYFTDIGVRPSKENPNPGPSRAAVYYLSPKGVLSKVVSDLERPNGVQLSTNEKTLYVADTAGQYILAYDVAEDGSLSNKREFAELAGWSNGENGWSSGADGLAVDALNRVYVASNVGIEVFDKDGDDLGVIPVPNKPQNLAFAGKDKKTLYIVGRGAAYKVELQTPGFAGRAK